MLTPANIQEIANGDEFAAAFLTAFQDRAHLLDDIEDRDRELTQQDLVAGEVDWLLMLAGNPFFQQHKAQLVPVMVLGLNAWRDSDHWRRSTDRQKQQAADVVKGVYSEMAFLVAFLVGGLGHMQKMSAKFRGYDFEKEQ